MDYRKIILSLFVTLSTLCGFSEEKTDSIDRVPKIHGVLRTRYEGEWNQENNPDGEDGYHQRFQVRNARVSLEGQLLKPLDWYIRVDLCDRGKMKFLDAWARWRFSPELAVKAGQYRVPFGVDAFRAPGTYIFANRSFIGKQMANVRQVGLQVGYYGRRIPLTVEAGIFNSAPMADHDVWQQSMDYAAKATFNLPVELTHSRPSNFCISGSFLSMNPYGIRMNLADAAIAWRLSNLQLSAEYQHLHYLIPNSSPTNQSLPDEAKIPDVNAWLVWANWAQPVRWGYFNQWNINARFDSMSNHSTGKPSDEGLLTINDPARKRLTLGTSIVCNISHFKAELMLDYEKYFYTADVAAPLGESDKLLLELIVKF